MVIKYKIKTLKKTLEGFLHLTQIGTSKPIDLVFVSNTIPLNDNYN